MRIFLRMCDRVKTHQMCQKLTKFTETSETLEKEEEEEEEEEKNQKNARFNKYFSLKRKYLNIRIFAFFVTLRGTKIRNCDFCNP